MHGSFGEGVLGALVLLRAPEQDPFGPDEVARAGILADVASVALRRSTLLEALRESEERLRLAMESAELGVWELDLRTRRSPVRSAWHDRIFGYSEPAEDWSYERFMNHVVPDDRAEVDRRFRTRSRRPAPGGLLPGAT